MASREETRILEKAATTTTPTMERGPSYSLHEDETASGSSRTFPNMNGHGEGLRQRPSHKSIPVTAQTGRIIDRQDTAFRRSFGRWNVKRKKVPEYWKLYLQDPFHSLVNLRLSKVMALLTLLYLVILFLFGWLYTTVPKDCKAAIVTYYDGFSFSVSVLFTIGFGTNGGDVFFNECVWMQTIITLESLIGVLLDAMAIGLIFQRFSRAQSRANTIVLSTNACVRRLRGNLYFMFQVCEMRKHQLVEAHVRMYAVRHDVEFGQHYYFQSYPMRIQHPDDDLGGMLLLALPSVVVHRMDSWSPLMRPKGATSCPLHHNPATSYLFPEPICRQADAESGDRDGTIVKDTNTKSQQFNACRCNDSQPAERRPSSSSNPSHQAEIEAIKAYWRESQLEIVVLVEGIDAVTSSTIQVRHSYKAEEILFDHRFENCVDVDPETGGAVIDFTRFHETQPIVEPDRVKVAGGFY